MYLFLRWAVDVNRLEFVQRGLDYSRMPADQFIRCANH